MTSPSSSHPTYPPPHGSSSHARLRQAVLPPCMRAGERERSYAKSVSVPRSLDSRCHAACRLVRRPPCTRMYGMRPRPSTPSTPTSRDVRSHKITPPACTRSLVLLSARPSSPLRSNVHMRPRPSPPTTPLASRDVRPRTLQSDHSSSSSMVCATPGRSSVRSSKAGPRPTRISS